MVIVVGGGGGGGDDVSDDGNDGGAGRAGCAVGRSQQVVSSRVFTVKGQHINGHLKQN